MAFAASTNCNRFAGSYSMSYRPHGDSSYYSIGRTSPEGINLQITDVVQGISGDQYGASEVDGFHSGRMVQLEFVLIQHESVGVQDFLYPWRTYSNSSTMLPALASNGPITGQLISEVAGDLLVIKDDNPDELAGSIFRGISVGPYNINHNTSARTIPVIFKVIPIFDDGYIVPKWWTTNLPDPL